MSSSDLLLGDAGVDDTIVTQVNYDHNEGLDSDNDGSINDNIAWMIIWLASVTFFLCFPVIFNERRRRLWIRRIRERRWISHEEFEEEEPDWYTLSQRQRQEERRQELETQHRQFQVSRTQADEIREQFLMVQLEKFTMMVQQDDILVVDHNGRKPLEEDVMSDTASSMTKTDKEATSPREEFSGDATSPVDIEAPVSTHDSANQVEDPSNNNVETGNQSDDDNDDWLETFEGTSDMVYVPPAGETNDSESPGPRRQVPNGCAICLCPFEAEDKICWSFNEGCRHVFHHDCTMQWYLAVGRKTQKKRRRQQTTPLSDDEELALICQFPMLCPCCRQPFCKGNDDEKEEDAELGPSPSTTDNPVPSGDTDTEIVVEADPSASAPINASPPENSTI